MKTRAPKDQIERYTNPGMTHFKGDKPNGAIPHGGFKAMRQHQTHDDEHHWSRGKATEQR